MSMTSLSQFPLLNHQTRKVQNSSLERHESEMLERQATEGSVVVSKNFLRSQLTVHRFPSLPIV